MLLFGAMLVTDALDGFLARWLKAQSELGRRLDSAGDYLTVAAGAAGIALLWPEIVRREWAWFAVGVVSYSAVIVYGLVRWKRVPGYHTWASKTVAVMFAVALVPLLGGWAAWPFRMVMALQVLTGVEELAIAFMLPGRSGEMPTIWHARRLRLGRDATR